MLNGEPGIRVCGQAGSVRAALAAVRRERERTPNVAVLHLLEGWALIGLGRAEEARPLAAAHEESLRRPYRVGIGAGLWHSIIAFHALSGSPAKAAVYLREAVTTHPLGLEAARAEYLRRFELDPRLRPQRDEPWVREALR